MGLDSLADVMAHARDKHREYSLMNGENGDEITIAPDEPSYGFVTVTVFNQQEED